MGKHDERWDDNKKNDSDVHKLRLNSWDNSLLGIEDFENLTNTWKRGMDDYRIKHKFNGRNPDTQKLHTKGSLNRELRAMDKAKK